jgi:AcrR family transcriptional regulator
MKRKRSVDERTESRPRRTPYGAAVMRPSVTEALTRALFEEWARTGYGALSLETVAKRARVGKAALYRRWPSKLAMVTERLEQIGASEAIFPEPPDTGSLRGDVKAWLAGLRRLLRQPLVRRILPDLHAEMVRTPELASAVRGRLQAEHCKCVAAILKHAIARKEIPAGVDLDLAVDAVAALIYWRMLVSEGADDKYLDRLTSFIVAALSCKH